MTDSLNGQKAALRATVRAALRELSSDARTKAARTLCECLVSQPVWRDAQAVLLFKPLADEPDIWPLAELALGQGKLLALPRFVESRNCYEAAVIEHPATDLAPGRFGVLEPAAICKAADLKRLDFALVPGVAFDWHGRRLGRGKGFYDRLLAEVSGTTCGVAFDQQLVATVPVAPHDIHLNCILTPSHWLQL